MRENRLTVVDLWIGGEVVHAPRSLRDMLLAVPPQYPTLHDMHSVVALCNGAHESTDATGENRMVGNPVDVSLLSAFGAVETLTLRNEATIVFERPFNSRDKNHIAIAMRSATSASAATSLGDQSATDRRDEKKAKKKKKKQQRATKAADDDNDVDVDNDKPAVAKRNADEPMRSYCKVNDARREYRE
jgi:magnesium-transporting ATPase (P-type)